MILVKEATEVKIYRNKRNHNKYIEVHKDGQGHSNVRQFMKFDNGVKNYTGDGRLHRWRRDNLDELLADYELVNDADNATDMKTGRYGLKNRIGESISSTSSIDYNRLKDMNLPAIASHLVDYIGLDASDDEIMEHIDKIIDKDHRMINLSWVEMDDEDLVNSKVEELKDMLLKRVHSEIEMERSTRDNDPMNGNKYIVSGIEVNHVETGSDRNIHNGGFCNDPRTAILKWLILSKKAPTCISIDTNKNAYADELLQWVVDNEEEFRSMCNKHKCPYKVDYMVNACRKGRTDNFETTYKFPDQIYPFALG